MTERTADIDALFCAIAADSIPGRMLRPIVNGWAAAWPGSDLHALVTRWSRLDRPTLVRSAALMLIVAAATNAVVTTFAGRPITTIEWGTRAVIVLISLFAVIRFSRERT